MQLVVATGNPYVDFSVAQRLNVDDGVPFVLDDRDSWVVDVYTGEPYPQSARTQQWLGWMLQRCEQAWFVNPPIAQWHQERYPRAGGPHPGRRERLGPALPRPGRGPPDGG